MVHSSWRVSSDIAATASEAIQPVWQRDHGHAEHFQRDQGTHYHCSSIRFKFRSSISLFSAFFSIVPNISKVVYSGDGKDYTKRALLKKIWNSKKVKAELGEPKHLWIWDGNKLAW